MDEPKEIEQEEKSNDCPKCGYSLVKYNDGLYRCGKCGFTTDNSIKKDQKFLK